MYRQADTLIQNSNGTKDTQPGSHNYRFAPLFCNDGENKFWQRHDEEKVDVGPWKESRTFYLEPTTGFHQNGQDVQCYLVRVVSDKQADSTQGSDHTRPNSIFDHQESTRGIGLSRRSSWAAGSSFGGDSDSGSIRSLGLSRRPSFNLPHDAPDSPKTAAGSSFRGNSDSTHGLGRSRHSSFNLPHDAPEPLKTAATPSYYPGIPVQV